MNAVKATNNATMVCQKRRKTGKIGRNEENLTRKSFRNVFLLEWLLSSIFCGSKMSANKIKKTILFLGSNVYSRKKCYVRPHIRRKIAIHQSLDPKYRLQGRSI